MSGFAFSVWPHERAEQALFDWLRLLGDSNRFECDWTPDEFAAFASGMERSGLTLREVELLDETALLGEDPPK